MARCRIGRINLCNRYRPLALTLRDIHEPEQSFGLRKSAAAQISRDRTYQVFCCLLRTDRPHRETNYILPRKAEAQSASSIALAQRTLSKQMRRDCCPPLG